MLVLSLPLNEESFYLYSRFVRWSRTRQHWNKFQILVSVGVCMYMTSDGPNDNLQSNCFQRQGRNIDELTTQIMIYLYIIAICLSLNTIGWFISWRNLKKLVFLRTFFSLNISGSLLCSFFSVRFEHRPTWNSPRQIF